MPIKKIYLILEGFRPRQWLKNLIIFAGIIFSQNLLRFDLLLRVIIAFFIFCLLSGCLYIINDIRDMDQDKYHPEKSKRPIASGRFSVFSGIIVVLFLAPILLLISYLLDPLFFLTAIIFFILQTGYSFYLKHIVILDVFAIAFGFLLRVIAGIVVINVEISSWLLICTILLALFLGFSKRRHEILILGDERTNHRKVLNEYSPYFLDQMISVVTASTLIAYTLYTISDETIKKFGTKNLIFTVPFVLYGIFRYLYLIYMKEIGGSPENIIITDKPLMISIILWIISAALILYL